jgi:hypothetical protein
MQETVIGERFKAVNVDGYRRNAVVAEPDD